MRDDLDRLMAEREIDWILARGYPHESSEVAFLTAGARMGDALLLKRRGAPTFVVCGAMERDEAAKSGLPFATWNDYGQAELAKLDMPPLEKSKRLHENVLRKHEVAGRVLFVGSLPVQRAVPLVRHLLAAFPAISLVEETDLETIVAARMTKSEDEILRMRDVARRTEEVVLEVVRLLASCERKGGFLHLTDGAPLKVGHVKDLIGLELARRRLDDKGQTIFAPGREAGFPHSRGADASPIPEGKTIIFDIFPQEKGGGYVFDFTRTLWVGTLGERARACFEAVDAAFLAACAAARPGVACTKVDGAACDAFQARGFATKREDAKLTTGYFHGLGHGVGLEVHERPNLNTFAANKDVLERGQVFTIEPGLYFPDEEIGVRIEETFTLAPDGSLSSFATLPRGSDELFALAARGR